jgi:hypothetical protein
LEGLNAAALGDIGGLDLKSRPGNQAATFGGPDLTGEGIQVSDGPSFWQEMGIVGGQMASDFSNKVADSYNTLAAWRPSMYLDTAMDGSQFDAVQGYFEQGLHLMTATGYQVSNDPYYGHMDAYNGGTGMANEAAKQAAIMVLTAGVGEAIGALSDSFGESMELTECGDVGACFTAGTKVLTNLGNMAIEQVRIGQRVITRPLGMEELEQPAIKVADYRVLRLESVNVSTQDIVHIALLRPWAMVEGLGIGDTVPLNILELELEGRGRVVGVVACPPLEQGPGELVTGTMNHGNIDVWQLAIEGLEEPLEATGHHPFYSEDQLEFVPLRSLHVGERLRTRSGTAVLQSISRKYGQWQVYNLEIGRVHQYYVSDVEVLVHNGCGSYTNTHASGMQYIGKGDVERALQSAAEKAATYSDPLTELEWTSASNDAESFAQEAQRMRNAGGPGGNTYNKIQSPGEKILQSRGQ